MNVLLNTYAFDVPWAADTLGKYIKPSMKVCVVALSFCAGWTEEQAESSRHRHMLLPAYAHYGIPAENISLIDWFHDTPESAKQKIQESDILFFTGGWPDHMMRRLEQWKLVEQIEAFPGLIMGCSAGAMVQFAHYYITPDEDYDTFSYHHGMNFVRQFYMEVHFNDTPIQHESIDRVRREQRKPIFAVYNDGGLVVDGDEVTVMGRVKYYGLDRT